MKIAGNKKIEASVAIIVTEGRTGGPIAKSYSSLLSYVSEGAVVIVVIETVFSKVADIDIGPAVIVVIAYGSAESPTIVGYASFLQLRR